MPAASEASAEHAVEARGLLPSDILSDGGPPQPGPRRRAAPSVRQPPAVPPGRATACVAGPRAPLYRAPHKVSVSAVSAILGTILASFWRPRRKAGRAGARAQCGRAATVSTAPASLPYYCFVVSRWNPRCLVPWPYTLRIYCEQCRPPPPPPLTPCSHPFFFLWMLASRQISSFSPQRPVDPVGPSGPLLCGVILFGSRRATSAGPGAGLR